MSLGSLLNIGQSALNASQTAMNTIGNNMANVNTPGYSRQYVRFEDSSYINAPGGARGQGVDTVEILRHFNKFVENSFVQRSSVASRWDEQTNYMSSIENVFNESNRDGVSSQMGNYFKSWEDLSKGPDEIYTRQSLVSNSDSIATLLRNSSESLKQIQSSADSAIKYDVNRANELIENISTLNNQINSVQIDGVNNANGLMDKRDQMTRELALIVDVKVDDRGGGDYHLQTQNGMPLVAGSEHYELAILPPRTDFVPSANSNYEGDIIIDGLDSHEYTVKFIEGGDVTDPPIEGAAVPTFIVSLDGGKTFLRGDDGEITEYKVTGTNDDAGNVVIDPINVKNLEISFTDSENFTADDRFAVMPKEGLYWIDATKGAINITPQMDFDGTDNTERLTGGTLTALFNVRDDNCGRYLDEIDAIAEALIWETNYLHSQGTGLEKLTNMQGTEAVKSTTAGLGTPQSGLAFSDKLTTGAMSFNFYNEDTGAIIGETATLNFNTTGIGPLENFDPEKHSLEDVQNAINTSFPNEAEPPVNQLKATIVDGKLNIESNPDADPPVDFHVVKDTSGVLAGLGLNTFYQGSDATDMAVNSAIHGNLNLINAGSVDASVGGGGVNVGDSAIANLIVQFGKSDINISTEWKNSDGQNIIEYYSSVVATVGSDTRSAMTNKDYNIALATDLDNQQASISGVSLDEEMANLIKFQHSYTAAAKLITTADQMIQTLLGIKQ